MLHVAVIGAGFGDEGKGQLVDFLAGKSQYSAVVRFNGGSQCGHTVVTPEGKKHVFSQIGAGAIHGLKTHLSRFIYANPIFLMREMIVFNDTFGFFPRISIDHHANIVLPMDVELGRHGASISQHGSTGHGLFVAVNRSINPKWLVTASDYFACSSSDQLVELAASYCESTGFEFGARQLAEFKSALEFLKDYVVLEHDNSVIDKHRCIFEGGQGLLLDQNSGLFPHVTPSNTGLTNIMSLLAGSADQVQPIYVTRTFISRHGAGPLHLPAFSQNAFEPKIDPDCVKDDTNIYNEWQGAMRYGPLNIDQLDFVIRRDTYFATQASGDPWRVRSPMLFVTWANMFPEVANLLDKKFLVFGMASERTRTDIDKQRWIL